MRNMTFDAAAFAITQLPLAKDPYRRCVLLDVGSHIGSFTEQVLAGRPDCYAYAFEPVDELYSYSVDKFANNSHVYVEHTALCEQSGNATVYKNNFSQGWYTLAPELAGGMMVTENITCTRFDDWAAGKRFGRTRLPSAVNYSLDGCEHPREAGPPSFIRIDVEGYQQSVLHGMHVEFLHWKYIQRLPVLDIKIGFGAVGHPNWNAVIAEFEWLFRNGYKREMYAVPNTTDVMLFPKPDMNHALR